MPRKKKSPQQETDAFDPDAPPPSWDCPDGTPADAAKCKACKQTNGCDHAPK